MLVLGLALIILQILEGRKTVIQAIGSGGSSICVGAILIGTSLRLENKDMASGYSSDTPKGSAGMIAQTAFSLLLVQHAITSNAA